ncbi:PssD/Cps14F family polysaccharide biosynthesis glycosyltransferase [Jeotgalibaca sp. A122]|uniref:PssD/Cps14F family polysaccharide biosynthesis glycosyltransferase n=1 Tax=Jeotgalibaca sp. A122 TaxID=3457322 RepID=UPI003FD286D6
MGNDEQNSPNEQKDINKYKKNIFILNSHFGKKIISGKSTSSMKKICFAASSGGHFEQLLMLKPLMDKYDGFILTEQTAYVTETKEEKMYYLKQVNRREKSFISRMIVNTITSLRIFIKEKPDIVICTGVLSMIPMCLIAKCFRRKLIYIESFAKITSPTETGRLLYKFSDQFYVQWEQMLEIYPKAIYKGGIY